MEKRARSALYCSLLPWEDAAAASGPRDVGLVIDTSGSMSGTREAMARSASKMVVDTLTSSDYVSIVRFSSSASMLGVTTALLLRW